MLTPDDLRDIVRVLDSTTLDEFSVETGDLAVILRRHQGKQWTAQTRVLRTPDVIGRVDEDAGPGVSERSAPPSAPAETGREHLHPITPPLPGTFYRSPQPGAPSFVEAGATVEPDTVVAIIETMKMMTSVCAGVAGRIADICLPDATFVEPDTVLMLVEVDAR